MKTTTRLAGEAQQPGPGGRALRGRLFERIMDRIYGYFVKLIRSRDGAEDCLQETLILLERSLQDGSYDPGRSFNRWMWLKAHRVYVDWCRKHDRRTRLVAGARPAGPSKGPESGVDARLDAARLVDHLQETLDDEAFEAFVLYYDQELTVTEIAGILGRSRKTVRKRLEEARRHALRLLGDEGPTGEEAEL